MAVENYRIKFAPCMIALMAIIFLSNGSLVLEGRKTEEVNDAELPRSKGTIKTIQCEDGDVIDCVNIYEQPAFDHPLLKNHKIDDVPEMFLNLSMPKVTQTWHKKGRCPQGTVPIRRTRKQDGYTKSSLINQPGTPQLNYTSPLVTSNHEYAIVNSPRGSYYGGRTTIYLWNPITEANEFSLAQIWVVSDTTGTLETLEAGWHVFPSFNGDYRTRFFIYWTRDYYQNTGCYNLLCSGFVQTNPKIVIGGSIPTSTYSASQHVMTITIYKGKASGNWILMWNNEVVGYWPMRIFNGLARRASLVQWGGEILNNKNAGHHTTTDMGSGHFSYEGFGKTNYMGDLRVVDGLNTLRYPQYIKPTVTNPRCYDIRVIDNANFYFGGPGYSNICN